MELITAYHQTPLLPSAYLSDIVRCKVFLKLENTQPSGSFKSRGISTLVAKKIQQSTTPEKVQIFSSSGGNAGLAAAYAAKLYHKPCTVVVPKTTKKATIDRLKAVGAIPIIYGDHWAEANSYLLNELIPSLPKDVEPVFCHPFDDEEIWNGHSSMVDEIKQQLSPLLGQGTIKPDAIILSVGGGGLYAGVVRGLQRNGWHDVPVIAVETEGAASLGKSIAAGKQVILDKIDTIASSLGSTFVPEEILHLAIKVHSTKPLAVTDSSAAKACIQFAQDHKFIVEPACGAALAPVYENKVKDLINLTPDSIVIVIVCGGSSTSVDDLMSYNDTFALPSPR